MRAGQGCKKRARIAVGVGKRDKTKIAAMIVRGGAWVGVIARRALGPWFGYDWVRIRVRVRSGLIIGTEFVCFMNTVQQLLAKHRKRA